MYGYDGYGNCCAPPALHGNPGLGGSTEGVGMAAFVWSALSTASMAVSAYHGYKRNRSIGWALVWGVLGAAAPVITPTIAVAQGYAKPR